MGIHGLLPFLDSKGCIQPFHEWPEGSSIAIDVPIFAYKFIYSERTYDALEKRFLLFAKDLVEKKCTPVFVFDGTKMDLKANELQKRSVLKNKTLDRYYEKQSKELEQALECANAYLLVEAISQVPQQSFQGIMFPTRKEYEKLEQFLKSNGFKTCVAKHEAEALCAYMCHTNQVWATLTEDSDSIAFGSPRTILRYFSEKPILVEYDKVLQTLELSKDSFTDLCCMFGCDFCNNVFLIGPQKSYQLLKKYSSWSIAYESAQYGWQERTRTSAILFHEKYPNVKKCFETFALELT